MDRLRFGGGPSGHRTATREARPHSGVRNAQERADTDHRLLPLPGLLRKHKAHQSALKLAFRSVYHDEGLVFAKEHPPSFGRPLQINNLGEREYRRLIKKAGVGPIKFHGLRHTCATLALKQGVHVKVVSEQLGHKNIEITLNRYAHALPSMQHDAAVTLGELFHA